MDAGTFLKWLEYHDACTEAREWVAGKTLAQAWNSTANPHWMIWLYIVAEQANGGTFDVRRFYLDMEAAGFDWKSDRAGRCNYIRHRLSLERLHVLLS
jgi:hypothetical protein